MKNLPFPIKVPKGLKPVITQPYGDPRNAEWYKANGININVHNGTDLTLSGDNRQGYGAELITPSEGWQIVKTTFDNPMSTKGNGVTLQSQPFTEDGIEKICQVVYWHCSEIKTERHVRPAYDTVAYVGNSGLVKPAPTPQCPYCGTHLHLMLFDFHKVNGFWVLQNADNGLNGAIDPALRFDFTKVIEGEDTGISKDLPPLVWAMNTLGLTQVWQKVAYLYKLFIK